jgi:hypothetical protein
MMDLRVLLVRILASLTVLAPVPLATLPVDAASSGAGAASFQIPPGVRSEGMGRAYAPLERSAFAAWANPGGLGFVRGVSAVSMRTRLVPDLADDVLYDYEAVVAGVGGPILGTPVTVSMGFNRIRLDYGESVLTDPGSPEPIGVFESFEFAHGVTFAAGVKDLAGVGVGIKRLEVDLASGLEDVDGRGRVTAYDHGFLVRTPAFPFRKVDAPEPLWSVVLTGGLSWLNRGGSIELVEGRGGDPLPKVRRESVGLDLDLLPARKVFPVSNRWLLRSLHDVHLLSVSAALGREKDLLVGDIPDSVAAHISENAAEGISNYRGIEIRFLDSFAVRFGRINDERGQVIGNTFGWGLSILGKIGVDYARIPQSRELSNVVKWGFWLRVPLDEPL